MSGANHSRKVLRHSIIMTLRAIRVIQGHNYTVVYDIVGY